MKIEDQVVSVELAKEMQELGVVQDSIWDWNFNSISKRYELGLASNKLFSERGIYNCYSAYTVAELGEKLPSGFYSYYDEYDGWTCSSSWGFCDINNPNNKSGPSDTLWGLCVSARQRRYTQEAETEANACVKMVIYLIKAGLITVEEVSEK